MPFQPADDPRSKTITIRLTEGERAKLVKRCKQERVSFSDFMRQLLEREGAI